MRQFSALLCAASSVITLAQPAPCDGLNAGFSYVPVGGGQQFSNATTGTGNTTTWHWDFGDGSTSTEPQPFHEYPSTGQYDVCLTAISIFIDGNGGATTCIDTTCLTVTWQGGDPCDGLEACFVPSQSALLTLFFNNCTHPSANTQYTWSFGDGASSADFAPTHMYAEPGTYAVCLTAYWQTCVDSICTTVVVQGGGDPCEGLNAGFQPFVVGTAVNFSNATSGTGEQTSWYWTFGDGSSSNDPQPYHLYALSGAYEVCLTAVSIYELVGGGVITCVDTTCTIVVVDDGDPCDDLLACFTTDLAGGTLVVFNNCTQPSTNVEYAWSFGDGSSSTGTHVDHLYQQPGTYTVCLTAYWGNCVDSTCTTVVVENDDPCDGLTAGFWWDSNGGTPENIFYSASPGDASHWLWSFGDGTYSDNGPQGTHTYPGPGEYQLCLTVYAYSPGTQDTCSVTSCQWVVIPEGNPCEDLNAGFSVQPNGLGVSFQNSVLNNDWSYLWNFGDGATGYGPNPDHTFPGPGAYTVCLTVWTWDPVAQDTCFADHCTWITVQGGTLCDQLSACFESSPIGNSAFQFFNCTTPQSSVQFVWHFGDGSTGTGISPDHVYQQPGTYTVCLTAYWENCVDEFCSTVTVGVGGPCAGDFTADFDWSAQGTAVVLHGTTNMPANGLIWFFGDGTTGYGEVITHLYEPPGPYTICLAAWYWNEPTQDTCWAEHCELVDLFDTGMDDPNTTTLRIYPQPASDLVTIEGLAGAAVLRLFASDGRLVLQERSTASSHRLDVTDLSAGMYVVSLDTDGRSLRYRIAVE